MVDRQKARLDRVTSLIGAGLLADASDYLDRDSILTDEQKQKLRHQLQDAKSARQRRRDALTRERNKSSLDNAGGKPKFDPARVKSLLSSLSSAQNVERLDSVLNAFSALESAEASLILARFGIDGGEPKAYWELASLTKLSVQRVRIIEERALQKIADRLSSDGLMQPDDDWVAAPTILAASASALDPISPLDGSMYIESRQESREPVAKPATASHESAHVVDVPAGTHYDLQVPLKHDDDDQLTRSPSDDRLSGETDDLDELLDLLRPISSHQQGTNTSLVTDDSVAIYAVYKGVKTKARLYPTVGAVEIVDGPLAGRDYATPSGAAKAVVAYYSPTVLNPLRNGWAFWLVYDGSGNQISVYRK